MAQYLDQFKDVIGKRQTEQILKLLNKKRNSGQIRTIKEFTQKLEELMRELTSNNLIPSLSLFSAKENEIIDADRQNEMTDRSEDDLSAAFEESINIDEIQKSHEALVRDVILKNLKAGVSELDSKISLYEFINKDKNGFDSAIFSTFRESKEGRTQRGVDQTQILFSDPRTNILLPASQDSTIELVGDRLTLSENSISLHSIISARQIFDSSTPQSELVVEPPTSKLSNMIDNTSGTYWIQSLLFSKLRSFIKIKLEFDLGATKETNLIEIDPISKYGLILESIHYLDNNNTITNLNIPEQTINGSGSVRFKKIATRRIILTFRNENPTNTQFEFQEETDTLFTQALVEPSLGYQAKLSTVNDELQELLASQKVKDIIGVIDSIKEKFIGYEFLTGFDNIRIGLTLYEPLSIYVSSPLSVCGIGELGLNSIEMRPYIDKIDQQIKFTNITYDLNKSSDLVDDTTLLVGEQSNVFFQNSIEHWIVKQDFDIDKKLIKTNTFPILPLGTNRIYHERLILTEKSNTSLTKNDLGKIIFFTNRTNGTIKVYRNGKLLADETGNVSAIDGWQEDPTPNTLGSTPGNGSRMYLRIKILNILISDIITVSYTPLVSSTSFIPIGVLDNFLTVGGLKIVDLAGDLSIRLNSGQIIILDQLDSNKNQTNSNIYLIILFRQNTANSSLSSAVEEYTLLSGCKDLTKFEEL